MVLPRRAFAAAPLALLARPVRAEVPVDLTLILAVDTSGSVNEARFQLQRSGYAAAFRAPRLVQAIAGGANQAIAVCMFQWTGPGMTAPVLDWTIVSDAASAASVSAIVAGAPRRLFGGGTSIGAAIDFAMTLFPPGAAGTRRVIDVSGDGANNRGRPAGDARDAAVDAGVVINGLPILGLEEDLDGYYRREVIGGPGAFVLPAASYDDFAAAILQKLITEIAGLAPERDDVWRNRQKV